MGLTAAMLGAANFLLLHRVNRVLSVLSVCRFDPIIIGLAFLRLASSQFFKEYFTLGGMTLWRQYLLAVIAELELVIPLVLVDAIMVSRCVKKVMLASGFLVLCGFWLRMLFISDNSWCENCEPLFLWFLSLTPKQQHQAALATWCIYMGKAAFQIVFRNKDFAFLSESFDAELLSESMTVGMQVGSTDPAMTAGQAVVPISPPVGHEEVQPSVLGRALGTVGSPVPLKTKQLGVGSMTCCGQAGCEHCMRRGAIDRTCMICPILSLFRVVGKCAGP